MQLKNWIAFSGLCGLAMMSIGCVCGPGGACGSSGLGPVVYRQSACDAACSSGCDNACSGDFSTGPRPLARLLRLTSCSGSSCGELYVDEWINEPPQADNCGLEECLQCGRSPIRTLVRTLVGRQYSGGCETCGCDDANVIGRGPIIHDGYEPGKWSSQRGCNCQSSATHHHHSSSGAFDPSEFHGETIIPSSPGLTPPAPSHGNGGAVDPSLPTPAPALPPSSASRLNPARRVMR